MIPERDDLCCWLSSPHQSATAAASGANQLLLWRADADDNNSCPPASNAINYSSRRTTSSQQPTAWSRYICYVEAMQSKGQKFDEKHALEAMFRGNDLVYRKNTAAAADCAS